MKFPHCRTVLRQYKEAATYVRGVDGEEYTESVFSYIDKCTEDVTEVKTFRCRNNERPWSAEV